MVIFGAKIGTTSNLKWQANEIPVDVQQNHGTKAT